MNVACTHCRTVYRIDPRKVPERGVRARCALCRGVFAVSPGEAGTRTDGVPTPAVATQGVTGRPTSPPPASATERPAPPDAPAAPAQAPAAAPASAAAQPRFGQQDPHAKARRLARALVSDMVTYQPERQRRGLSDGSLRQEFREEIRKSWEEYVEQVGKELAHSTPYFRDALNEILARGQQIF